MISASLNILGLILNTIAAVVLIIPNLKVTKNIDDDLIVLSDQKTGNYTQKKHLRERKLNIAGLVLLVLGFLLQLIGTILA